MAKELEGYVESLPSGKFRPKLRGVQVGPVCDTREEAQRLIDARKLLEKGEWHERSVRVQGDAYLKKREMAERSRRGGEQFAYVEHEQNQPLWDRYVATSKIISMRVEDVRREHVMDLIEGIVGSPRMRYSKRTKQLEPTGEVVGKRTAQKVLTLLKGFFKACRGLSKFGNPVHDIQIPKVLKQRHRFDSDRIPHLHTDEIERLMGLSIDIFTQFHRTFYVTMIYAGCRKGEACGLKWQYVLNLNGNPLDPDKDKRPMIRIQHSYKGPPKNESSNRYIPLLPQAIKEYKAYRAALVASGATKEQLSGEALVFPNRDGDCRSMHWDPQWRDVKEAKGRHASSGFRTLARIRAHIQIKNLRHTFGTHMVRGTFFASRHKFRAIDVATWMGHVDTKMVFKHYMSRDVDNLHDAIDEAFETSTDKEAAE